MISGSEKENMINQLNHEKQDHFNLNNSIA